MTPFKVVIVIKDRNPRPAWVAGRLEAAGVDFFEQICWNVEDLARYAGDADVVWSYGGRHGLLHGENLRVLQKCGAILRIGSGTDNIDIEMATELGILVVNTPYVTTDPVADQAISLLFSLVRLVVPQDRLVHRGVWDGWRLMPLRRFHGATLGLLGFGRIPRSIVKKLSGFEMEFIAYDPFVTSETMASHGVKSVSLDTVLALADYVSLHIPLSESTRHLLGEREFRLMKTDAVFVNTSRGAVVDEAALIKALQEGWIAGAALDVMEKEPPEFNNPLLSMDNVVLTPHIGGYADTFPQEMCEASLEVILDLKERRWPLSVVNPEVRPRWGSLTPRNSGPE